MLIPPRAKKRRRNSKSNEDEENKLDRLNDLPDGILLHILSFMEAKYAVQTCILSTRWKDLWKHLPTLILHSLNFCTFERFVRFVCRILALRNGSTRLEGLDFEHMGRMTPRLLKMIMKYVVSHNIQRLGLTVTSIGIQHIQPGIFSCKTLTSLKLLLHTKWFAKKKEKLFPKTLNLPALTTLHLVNFTFCGNGHDDDGVAPAEPFSIFSRLNSLIIEKCELSDDAQILCISNTTLVSLTVLYLKCKMHLSSPILRTFAFTGNPCYNLCGRNISSIEHVNFDIQLTHRSRKSSSLLLTWLMDLANIKSLTVSVLTSRPRLLKHKYPILGSLRSLKVKMIIPEASKEEDPFSFINSISNRIIDFLLQNSPLAKVGIIRCSR